MDWTWKVYENRAGYYDYIPQHEPTTNRLIRENLALRDAIALCDEYNNERN